MANFIGYLIGIVFLGAPICWFLWLIIRAAGVTEKRNNNKKKFGATKSNALKHVAGLPYAQGTIVEVYYGDNGFVFLKDGQEVSVSMDKITSIDCVYGKDVQTQMASGAVVGKLVLGSTVGALIGAAAATTLYMVISYKSNGERKSVVLDTAFSGSFASKTEKAFKASHPVNTERIEL